MAQLPEVQGIILRGIARGTIRAVPAAGGGIRISPTTDESSFQTRESAPLPSPSSIGPVTVPVRSAERSAR